MNFFDLVNKRESVRGYLDKEVEKEKIIKIIEAARVAPSACNAQPRKFVVVNDKNLVSALPEYISLAMALEMTAPAPPVNP